MATSTRSVRRRTGLHAGFGLFAECMLTGVWLVIAALPLVTLLPAFAAACGHLRRYLAGERAGWREFAAGVVTGTRTGWRWSLLWWAGLALLAFDLTVARSGLLPGGRVLAAVAVTVMVALAVVGLRTAACRPYGVRVAVRRSAADPGGSLLLAGGLAVVAVAGWMLLPLAVPALGALAGAAVAVERRVGG